LPKIRLGLLNVMLIKNMDSWHWSCFITAS